jgi:hypothetical protein
LKIVSECRLRAGSSRRQPPLKKLDDSGECFTKGRESLMIVTGQLVHPDLSLAVHHVDLLRLHTTFHHNLTLADSQSTISSSVHVESFHVCVNAINDASLDITNKNITDFSGLAGEFGFTELPC